MGKRDERITALEARVRRLLRYIEADNAYIHAVDYTDAEADDYYDALHDCRVHNDFDPLPRDNK